MKDWTAFGLRHLPEMSARDRVVSVPAIQDEIDAAMVEFSAELAAPLRGVTTDGRVIPGLFTAGRGTVDTAPAREAALAFLEALDPADRPKARSPLDAGERRQWFNIHANFFRHGVMLENLTAAQRQRGIQLLQATLSARGFAQARDIMRLNGLLAAITGNTDQYGEWPYFLSIFGTPSAAEPWGWQLDGHHLNVNCFVLGDQLVLTPTFMGSEPCRVTSGALAGTEVFTLEQQAGIDLVRSLDAVQHDTAVLYPSIMPGALPKHLEHWVDGRMQAAAFRDNAILPYQGLRADGLSDAQRALLRKAVGAFWAGGAMTMPPRARRRSTATSTKPGSHGSAAPATAIRSIIESTARSCSLSSTTIRASRSTTTCQPGTTFTRSCVPPTAATTAPTSSPATTPSLTTPTAATADRLSPRSEGILKIARK